MNNEKIEEFWKRINTLLKEKGFTQEKFSIECGFTPNRINNWTSKKTLPNVFEAYTIAEKLEVSLNYLITGKYTVDNDSAHLIEEAQKIALEAIKVLQRPLPEHRRKELNLPSSSQQ